MKKIPFILSLSAFLLLFSGLYFYASQYNYVPLVQSPPAAQAPTFTTFDPLPPDGRFIAETKDNTDTEEKVKFSGRQIALFGLDRRADYQVSRADSIMVYRLADGASTPQLISFMRDMYVQIPGYGWDKLNHAYSYGGASLQVNTLNNVFGLAITDYIAVDFFMLEAIIDTLGGVTIDIAANELNVLNRLVKETAKIQGESATFLKEAGPQKLNGAQAVAYARIRAIGNGDFERTSRQQTVIKAIAKEAKNVSLLKLPELVTTIMTYTESSLTQIEFLQLAKQTVLGSMDFESMRIPRDGYFKGGRSPSGASILNVDLVAEKRFLQSMDEPLSGVVE